MFQELITLINSTLTLTLINIVNIFDLFCDFIYFSFAYVLISTSLRKIMIYLGDIF